MTAHILSPDTESCSTLCEMGMKTHRLLERSIAAGLHDEVQTLLYINDHFLDMWAKAHEAARQEALRQQEAGYTHYIWRTSGDGRVRSSHAANEGRIFAWGNPPSTGHPGEDYGCRCRAEPYAGRAIHDPPIEPVYFEVILLPLLNVSRSVFFLAANVMRRVWGNGKIEKPDNFTQHGAIRSGQRRVSSQEADEAIRTAKETGDVVTKMGKYGTPQIHYRGTNGITVIVETAGRNAGKIITFWRH